MTWGTWTITQLLERGPDSAQRPDGCVVAAGVGSSGVAVRDARVAAGEPVNTAADPLRQCLDAVLGVGFAARFISSADLRCPRVRPAFLSYLRKQ